MSQNAHSGKKVRGPRYIAIEILCRWEERHLPLDQIIGQYFTEIAPDAGRDRQLIISLVNGVVRWRSYIDWVLGRFSSYPLTKMKIRTLQALRVGTFQMFFLDRIPPSAAVNETVQAFKDMRQPQWLSGFINGILRNMERQHLTIPTPFRNKDAVPETALLSHPEWLIQRWKERYGERQAIALCEANNRQAHLCLRVNTRLSTPLALIGKLKAAGIDAKMGKFSPIAVRIDNYRGPIVTLPGFSEGLFQVQGEAAQLVTLLLGPLQPGKTYLDGCAGLGGKFSHLAQIIPAGTNLEAIEQNFSRVQKLRENLARLRLEKTVTIVEGKIELLLPDRKEKYAGVLIDAPCSGLGVIRKHPEIRWHRTPGDLVRYHEIQSALLGTAADLVAPGGVLVYATCSIEPEENEEVVKEFLEHQPHFSVTDSRENLPATCASLVDSAGFFRTMPFPDGLDGFFAARLIKN